MITLTFGTVAFANAYVSFAAAFAIFFSESTVASKPFTLVRVSTGISNASQKFTNSTAFSAPSTVSTGSNFSAASPSSSKRTVLLATAPTVVPLIFNRPVTTLFANSDFTSINKPSSAISVNASTASAASASISAHALFKSSSQSA